MFQGRAARLLKHRQIVHERPMGSRSMHTMAQYRQYSTAGRPRRVLRLLFSIPNITSSRVRPQTNTTPGRITTTALMPCPSHTLPIHSLHLVITLPTPQCSRPQPPRPLVLPPRRVLSRVWTATAPPRRGRSTAWPQRRAACSRPRRRRVAQAVVKRTDPVRRRLWASRPVLEVSVRHVMFITCITITC